MASKVLMSRNDFIESSKMLIFVQRYTLKFALLFFNTFLAKLYFGDNYYI
jgi:hypothetical protein